MEESTQRERKVEEQGRNIGGGGEALGTREQLYKLEGGGGGEGGR